MKNLTNLLNANKICLNISKTEAILFKSARKHSDVSLKLKVNEKRKYFDIVKYFDIKVDENFIWKR